VNDQPLTRLYTQCALEALQSRQPARHTSVPLVGVACVWSQHVSRSAVL
jgi:hypothetical protein